MRCGKILLIFRIIALIIAFGLVAVDSRYCCGGVLVVGGRRVGVGEFGGGGGGVIAVRMFGAGLTCFYSIF